MIDIFAAGLLTDEQEAEIKAKYGELPPPPYSMRGVDEEGFMKKYCSDCKNFEKHCLIGFDDEPGTCPAFEWRDLRLASAEHWTNVLKNLTDEFELIPKDVCWRLIRDIEAAE